MSDFTSLMVREVTIQTATESVDGYGNSVRDWDTPGEVTVNGWLAQRDASESYENRDAFVQHWVLYLPAGTDLTAADRVVCDGVTYEVEGPPNRAGEPVAGAWVEHHLEAVLRAVAG